MNPLPLSLVDRLLPWHIAHRAALPWRDDPTPYHVWISEIMLQQTRIEAVIPYYTRFLRELPDVASLAAVEEDRLLKLWEGLGYYSRARNLKKAAVQLMETTGGTLPCTVPELRKLPGIGAYTAGAIASLACGQPEPAVDGNVLRVLTRLTACGDDVLAESTKKATADALRDIYPSGKDAGLFTEALMGLGQQVCLPSSPACDACPLADLCESHRRGCETAYPCKAEKKPRRIEYRAVYLLRREGRYAIRKRPRAGLLAGMWEFPNHLLPTPPAEPVENPAISPEEGSFPQLHCLGHAKHIFSHVEWHMTGYEAELDENTALPSDFLWKTAAEIRTEYALPSAFRAWENCLRDE